VTVTVAPLNLLANQGRATSRQAGRRAYREEVRTEAAHCAMHRCRQSNDRSGRGHSGGLHHEPSRPEPGCDQVTAWTGGGKRPVHPPGLRGLNRLRCSSPHGSRSIRGSVGEDEGHGGAGGAFAVRIGADVEPDLVAWIGVVEIGRWMWGCRGGIKVILAVRPYIFSSSTAKDRCARERPSPGCAAAR
jgi:hypothetical protein